MARNNSRKRKKNKQIGSSIALLIIVSVIYVSAQLLLACDKDSRNENIEGGFDKAYSEELQKVVTNPALEEILVEYPGMKISFNPRLHIPNWVAWELTASETSGDESRLNTFYCDERVAGCPDTWDYSYSGYDRGHMAPAGDMKWGSEAMRCSFYLTNICPQSPDLNRGTWSRLEEKCRDRARTDSAIIIVCGPVLTDELTEFIGDSKVAVPKRFFKVILSPYKENPVAIGFIMPNGTVPGGMQPHSVSVDSVESATGHDFFSILPDDLERKIESTFNFNKWSRMQ